MISGERSQWLDVVPETGSIPPGGTATLTASFDAQDHLPGLYTGQLRIGSNDPQHPVVSIPASLYIRLPGTLVVSPDSITQTVAPGQTVTHTLTLANTGTSPLNFDFNDTPMVGAPAPGTILYHTDFDDMVLGGGTTGWGSYWGQMSFVQEADGTGNFLQGVSTATQDVMLKTPFPYTNPPEIISIRMDVGFTGDLKFRMTPGQYSGEGIAVEYNAFEDNVLTIYSYDTASATYVPHQVPRPAHAGVFNLRVDLKRLTKTFDVYLDGRLAFRGMTKIDNFNSNFISAENAGTFYLETFTVTDGLRPEYIKTFSPASGTLEPGASTTVDVTFEPVTKLGGTYRDTLTITGSPVDIVRIPVHFEVEQNVAPVLQQIDTVEVTQYSQKTIVLKATDADNEYVTISLGNAPAFVTREASGNGFARYKIAPRPQDVGEYDLRAVAVDAAGGRDSIVFRLSVIAYGTATFHMKNIRTGSVFATFADSIVLDVADREYKWFQIVAETRPAKVGSVKFWWDNHVTNVENVIPYTLSPSVLPLAKGGHHKLRTQAFTKANAKGSKGVAQEAIVRIINSSSVAGLDVVKANGTKLFALTDNSVIDISQAACHSINIRANAVGDAVKSVVFMLNGKFYRVDNTAPFVLNGNIFGYDMPWPARPGWYTLKVIPYSSWYGMGVAGKPITISFRIINGSHGNGHGREAGEEDILQDARKSF